MASYFTDYPPARPRTPSNVRSSSRGIVLDALEYEIPTSANRLAERSELGEATIRRACHQLLREGVLSLTYGVDSVSGRSRDLLTFARYPALPILEITDHALTWRLCDTRGESVCSVVRDLNGPFLPDNDLLPLMAQATAHLRAETGNLPPTISLPAPALLCPAEQRKWLPYVCDALEGQPSFLLLPEEAVAVELRYLLEATEAREANSALHIHTGEVCSVTLFHRADGRSDGGGRPESGGIPAPFVPVGYASTLNETLAGYTRGVRPHTTAWWQRIAAFLGDLFRFLTPSCVVLETDRTEAGASILREALREMRPAPIPLIRVSYTLNLPPLAHRGALRLLRRALWDSNGQQHD